MLTILAAYKRGKHFGLHHKGNCTFLADSTQDMCFSILRTTQSCGPVFRDIMYKRSPYPTEPYLANKKRRQRSTITGHHKDMSYQIPDITKIWATKYQTSQRYEPTNTSHHKDMSQQIQGITKTWANKYQPSQRHEPINTRHHKDMSQQIPDITKTWANKY